MLRLISILVLLLNSFTAPSALPVVTNPTVEAFKETAVPWDKFDVALSFVGKGSSVPVDAGVLQALIEKIPSLGDPGKVILSGSSSGSIAAIYLSCFGVNPTSVKKLSDFLVKGTPAINEALQVLRESENPLTKLKNFFTLGKALPTSNLYPYGAAAVGLENVSDKELETLSPDMVNKRATCRNEVPVVIVAANQEVLENRLNAKATLLNPLTQIDYAKGEIKPGTKFPTRGDKLIDYSNFSVEWKSARHKYYAGSEAGRKEFATNHPHLNLRKDGLVGKACTYFADETAAKLLALVPHEERLCDIRVMKTAYDRVLAILVSSAEPTYYDEITEQAPEKLDLGTGYGGMIEARKIASAQQPIDGTVASSRIRNYWGGFAMPSVLQDIRRVLPQVIGIATGFNRLEMEQEGKLIQAYSTVSSKEISKRTEYWADFTIRFDDQTRAAIRGRLLDRQQEFNAGYEITKKCIRSEETDDGADKFCRPYKHEIINAKLAPEAKGMSLEARRARRKKAIEDDEIIEDPFYFMATADAYWESPNAKAELSDKNLPVGRGITGLLK